MDEKRVRCGTEEEWRTAQPPASSSLTALYGHNRLRLPSSFAYILDSMPHRWVLKKTVEEFPAPINAGWWDTVYTHSMATHRICREAQRRIAPRTRNASGGSSRSPTKAFWFDTETTPLLLYPTHRSHVWFCNAEKSCKLWMGWKKKKHLQTTLFEARRDLNWKTSMR